VPDGTLDPEQRRDWLRLSLSENVGALAFHQLIRRYGNARNALRALPELAGRGGLKRPFRICTPEEADSYMHRIDALGARLVGVDEEEYPPLLRHIDSAPPLLCLKGDFACLRRPIVAIVGSRNASALGRKFARQLAAELGEAGFTVASGHARGIDTAAHQGALATGTVAALAGGMDIVYPPENVTLHAQIAERGMLMTECMPGTIPTEKHFPRRNRLISGMSYGVVVVEAALRSGSLITARYALEQGREVLAVPGSPLDPRAEGANRLLREGAVLARNAADVIEALTPMVKGEGTSVRGEFREEEPPGHEQAAGGDDLQSRILLLLGPAPVGIDDLIRESGSAPGPVLSVLLELELAGRLVRHPRGAVSLL
jgi:DNA processing protein